MGDPKSSRPMGLDSRSTTMRESLGRMGHPNYMARNNRFLTNRKNSG
jgi:hypothetical protein